MEKTKLYINSSACISAQQTFDDGSFLISDSVNNNSPRSSVEPDYKTWIDRKYLRRMGRMVRMGVCSAKKCLSEAGANDLDAILVGTGMGCLKDTEDFLKAIYESDEQIASPNQFIQSTHNNVAAQIAIMLGCYSYNFTYVHRGFSFETALLDAWLHMAEAGNEKKQILVGSSDELTETYQEVTSNLKFWQPQNHLNDNNEFLQGAEPGEGAAFFVLSNQKSNTTKAQIEGLRTIYKPQSKDELVGVVQLLINSVGINLQDIDLVLIGHDGMSPQSGIFKEACDSLFTSHQIGYFKHLSGEYKTASSFALWLAGEMIDKQYIPSFIGSDKFGAQELNRVLIFNNYNSSNFTLTLLRNA